MKIYDRLKNKSPYKNNDRVQGIIYSFNPQYGYFVAVDNMYHGLILLKEAYGNYSIGGMVNARIKKVREDGKLELSERESTVDAIESDAQKIMDLLKNRNGKLDLNDDSSPEKINNELHMSKKAFKRAVGRLMKEGAVKLTDKGIESLF